MCSCTQHGGFFVQSGVYWSASTHAVDPSSSWVVNDSGGVGGINKTNDFYVRAVSGGL